MKRLLIIALVLIVAAGGAWYWYGEGKTETKTAPRTVAVTKGDIENTVLATGMLEASSLVSVGAQVSGIIKNVDVKLGQTVKAGDLIVEIDSTNQENAVKSAEASLANIEAEKAGQEATIAQAQSAFDRAQNMQAQNLMSAADYESAKATLESAKAKLKSYEAQIEQAKISVETAKVDLSHTKITAPSSGTVVAVLVDPGQTINANSTAPTVVKIANLDTMEIQAEISEADVIKVAPGQRVYFTILGNPDKKIDATLKSVDPAPPELQDSDTIDSGTAIYYDGIFEVPNPDHELRIGMTAKVTIVIAEANDVLTVPSSALAGPGPNGKYSVEVWDPKTETRRRVPVEVGLNNKVTAEIKSGLELGEQVVATASTASMPSNGNGNGGGPRMRSPLGF